MTLLVTGGAGFIGSNFVLDWLAQSDEPVVNLDALTYAGNLENLADAARRRAPPSSCTATSATAPCSIACSPSTGRARWCTSPPRATSTAASTGPAPSCAPTSKARFTLLEAARALLADAARQRARGLPLPHVSTDEVYGSLAPDAPAFTEAHPYEPNSPYSASKAASDHLVRAWHHTYGLPVLTTNCSNNYGPYQFPEKLIPLMIVNALAGKPLPIYGDGMNVRDWLYVRDHCSAHPRRAGSEAASARPTTSAAGTRCPTSEIVQTRLRAARRTAPRPAGPHERLITYVTDRPGHDRRYAIDARKIERELGWRPAETFDTGIRKTVRWYLDHADWVAHVQAGAYRDWVERQYSPRPPMKILLFGCNGQVGWELQRSLAPLGELVALDFDSTDLRADFSRPDELAGTVRAVRPDVIVNAAAHTAVDKAESRARAGAHHQRRGARRAGARGCRGSNAWLVHYSTDYVFDGSGEHAVDGRRPDRPAERLRPHQARGRASRARQRLPAT